jgi:hypothetical protein
MNIEEARKLRVGSRVKCPEDQGSAGFTGVVVHVGSIESRSAEGTPYMWVTVRNSHHQRAVWPTNRLSSISGIAGATK